MNRSNRTRLQHFIKSRAKKQNQKFVAHTNHVNIRKNDACYVVGIIDGWEYANGYKSLEAGQNAANALNEDLFPAAEENEEEE